MPVGSGSIKRAVNTTSQAAKKEETKPAVEAKEAVKAEVKKETKTTAKKTPAKKTPAKKTTVTKATSSKPSTKKPAETKTKNIVAKNDKKSTTIYEVGQDLPIYLM